jgi:hypothetical protein
MDPPEVRLLANYLGDDKFCSMGQVRQNRTSRKSCSFWTTGAEAPVQQGAPKEQARRL